MLWKALPVSAGVYALFAYSPPFHHGAAMAVLYYVIGALLQKTLWHFKEFIAPSSASHGSARFANLDDLASSKLTGKRGLVLGRKIGRLLRYAGSGHLLTFAPTRSGKGVGCVIPNLLTHPGSVIVTDIKGENAGITAEYRSTLGPVYRLAPLSPVHNSARYNPMDFVRISTPYEVDDARLIAEMLVVPERDEPNHWEREARTLITGLILYVRHHKEVTKRNLSTVRDLLMQEVEEFELMLAEMLSSHQENIVRLAAGFSQKEEKERSGVISSAQAATELFESPKLRDCTSQSDFSLESLKDETASLYLIIPPEYLDSYRSYLRLMIGLATAAMTRNTNQPRYDVLFLLDELPALGYMRPIEEGIGYLAGYGAKLWLFVQDLDQLDKTYRKSRSIIANCAVRQAFNVQDIKTANMLSEMLGTSTIRTLSQGSSSPLPVRLFSIAFHQGIIETGRKLLTPDEIMTLPKHEQLLFVETEHPIRCNKLRYFDWQEWRLKRRASLLTETD